MNKLCKVSIVGILLTMCCWTWIGYDMDDSIRGLRMDVQVLMNVAKQHRSGISLLTEQVTALDFRTVVAKGSKSVLVVYGVNGHGSCFFLDKAAGVLVTAAHVIRDSQASDLCVKQGVVSAPVKEIRWSKDLDVGLIFIDSVLAQLFSAEEFVLGTTSSTLGDVVLSVGYPIDMNDSSYASLGLVIGLDVNDVVTFDPTYQHMLKFHLEVLPGMSGGPILNVAGEVVSINCVILSNTQIALGPSIENLRIAISQLLCQVDGENPEVIWEETFDDSETGSIF